MIPIPKKLKFGDIIRYHRLNTKQSIPDISRISHVPKMYWMSVESNNTQVLDYSMLDKLISHLTIKKYSRTYNYLYDQIRQNKMKSGHYPKIKGVSGCKAIL